MRSFYPARSERRVRADARRGKQRGETTVERPSLAAGPCLLSVRLRVVTPTHTEAPVVPCPFPLRAPRGRTAAGAPSFAPDLRVLCLVHERPSRPVEPEREGEEGGPQGPSPRTRGARSLAAEQSPPSLREGNLCSSRSGLPRAPEALGAAAEPPRSRGPRPGCRARRGRAEEEAERTSRGRARGAVSCFIRAGIARSLERERPNDPDQNPS